MVAPETPTARADAGGCRPGSEQSDGFFQRRCLKAFREFDSSGDGNISPNELQQALERTGIQLSSREFRKFVAEVDADGDRQISFPEFCELVKQLQTSQAKYKSKNTRIARLYMPPETYDYFSNTFHETAGDDGQLSVVELDAFFKKCQITVPPEKLQALMQEVDDDESGFLEESEFMALVVKAANMKKRKVGPGACSLAALRDEGWTLAELRKVGYEARDFIEESSCTVSDLMDVFSVAELRKAGTGLDEVLAAGWDAMDARQSGFSLEELLQAGCSMRKLKLAGWNDVLSAAQLRKLGVDAERMRLGGWTLSQLRTAGYSSAALRLAGFAPSAVAALQRVVARQEAAKKGEAKPPLQRQTTFEVREEVEERLRQEAQRAEKAAADTEHEQQRHGLAASNLDQ